MQPNPEDVIKRIDEGFRFIAYSLDITIIGTYYREGLNKIKENIK